MSKLLMLYLTLPLTMVILFQPFLNDIEEGRNFIAQVALEQGIEKAAIEGKFTPAIKQEIYDLLALVGYEQQDIVLNVTEIQKYRGEYLEGLVKVPNVYHQILITSFFSKDPESEDSLYHVHKAVRMSEYID